MVKLDIFADPACPWCYVGKAYLDRALEKSGDHPFIVEWHPFQLNPDMPAEGMDRADYLEIVFGSKEKAVEAHVELMDHAAKAGISFDFEKIKRSPNTLDAHRLVYWAGLESKQTPTMTALMQAYWRDGRDISDHEVLCDIGDSVGLDASVIARLLKTDSDIESIQRRDAHSREMGVKSVPTYIVAGQHAVPGAQNTELWMNVISDIQKMLKEQPAQD